MTDITVSRELLRQSQEQLDRYCHHINECRAIADAIRDTLDAEPVLVIDKQTEWVTGAELAASMAAPVQEPVTTQWERFPAYLIDKWEGETISEEGLQRALSDMLNDPTYTAPRKAVKLTSDDWYWVCNECGSPEYTSCVSEADIQELGCGNCGGDEWHKEPMKDHQ